MGLFSKREKVRQRKEGTELAGHQPRELVEVEDRRNEGRLCFSRLEAQFLMQNRGVVLKLYIENFKHMNNMFGFEYCDTLLEKIMDYMEKKTGCTVYRYVGVEFIVILRNRTMKDAVRIAEELLERFNRNWLIGDTDCICTAQIALCAYPGHVSNAAEMLKCLDMAASQAAELGGNQYAVYDQALHTQFVRQQAIAKYLGTAIAKDEVEISYRPAYNRKLQKFTRAGFIMRIFIENVGMVSSGEYLAIAEDTGQIRQVEYYALDKVAALIARLMKAGVEFASISLPLSPVLFLQRDLLQEVTRVLDKYQIPPKKLAVEIDEYAADHSYANIAATLQHLSWLGVEVILTNFGSGGTGLMKIFDLPVDTVKLSRMFIWQLENNPRSAPVNAGLVQIAKKMDKNVIAEGVETQRQRECLDRFGCDLQQGPFYTPVMPESELITLLGASPENLRRFEWHEQGYDRKGARR